MSVLPQPSDVPPAVDPAPTGLGRTPMPTPPPTAPLTNRASTLLAAAALALLSACNSTSEPLPPLDGRADVQGSVLTVRGDEEPNRIVITGTDQGVRVELDAESALFEDVARVEVEAGGGDDLFRYFQTVVRDLHLTLNAGDGDDDVGMLLTPEGAGEAMSLVTAVDLGGGDDRLDFGWNSTASPALDVSLALDVGGSLSLPEVGDEVLVSFQSGDPDRPVIIGTVWNPKGPTSDPGAGVAAAALALSADVSADSVVTELALTGGPGRDSADVSVDYSGVAAQQGRVLLDADLGEGDNHLGKYIVTGVTHASVRTHVLAGDGANVVDLDTELGGDGDAVYTVELGDGDNAGRVSFGDGVRGARPTTGERNVTATYRTGAGSNTLELAGHAVEPLTSDVTLDFGTGSGSVLARYGVMDVPPADTPPGTQLAPSQTTVVVMGDDIDMDLEIAVADPDPDDGADEPGSIAMVGSGLQAGRVRFLRLAGVPLRPAGTPSEPEDEWTLEVSGWTLAGPGSITAAAGGALHRLVYLQSSTTVQAGAALDVSLKGHAGNDAMLAHLIGVSGDGAYGFAADGGTGDDFVAALSRDLSPTGTGSLSFEVRGGDGGDTAAMEAPVDLQRSGPVAHLVDAGPATDACYASTVVAAVACETRETITVQFLQILADLFGAELAGVWSPPPPT